ncbi:signal peptide peptidase SppA [Acetivibrio straminisolvens]|jgi:protease-4|uniref:Protease IV n=1 Tax=Acetivibrio straminisolvens JCM 21531 TaxID=1294263 RepID=W4V2U5_9FIRM|nr:signal peptide peptidase SppA [Acetivibrio straminisolvens]GAE87158.1 protease IV [Acetivibrio straminisolvens JCM 21531]
MNKKQLIGLIVAGVVFVFVCSSSILMNTVSKKMGTSFKLNETANSLPLTPYIGVVSVEGTIMDSGSTTSFMSNSYNHKDTLELIEDMKNSASNKGILLYVNSPGGGVYESDELYLKLKEYREETGRPVWTYMSNQACSGGYYISMASDKVYSNRNAWTGSIGVIISLTNLKELYDNIGIKGIYITSGKNKAMGAADLDLTDEQRDILQSLVDEAYEQFVEIVAEGRKMTADEVKRIADGRILSAKQALELNLIDEIATYEEVKEAFSMELGNVEVYTPKKKDPFGLSSLFGYISSLRPRSDTEIIAELIKANGNGVPMYYAMPGQY